MNTFVQGVFSLKDHHDRPVTQESYKGRWILAFFGFTHCQVVCPRTLSRLSGVIEDLGSAAEKVHALYITVDPDRDTPDVMRTFLASYPAFTGLTGTNAQVEQAKENFQVFARQRAKSRDDDYQIAHTALTYLIDPDGNFVTHWSATYDPVHLREELATLLNS
ncbi:SCO family protein [Streptomyces tanashiensis]|uniref:SCO family protein n=1 Tax=Streptomyces tanashiensis TaxID=67367 RepID=UPI0036EE2A13